MLQHPFARFTLHLWPLLLVFVLGQIIMGWSGNSQALGISIILSLVDLLAFLLVFGVAALLSSRSLNSCLNLAHPEKNARRIETLMAYFPWRVLKVFSIAGICFTLYLLSVVSLNALITGHALTSSMLIALFLSFAFGGVILAPALAVANAIVFSVNKRLSLSSRGLFQGQLDEGHSFRQFTSASLRPWLVFMVTGLIPTMILSAYVYLALNGGEASRHFILMQALVLLSMSVSASMLLVWTISHTLKCVSAELEAGLKKLADGQFDTHVPVLMNDEFGDLALGLNTALRGLREREDLKDSLAIAAEIQQGLLPKFAPVIPAYQLQGFQKTCFSVGGDYYDYIELEDGRVWLMIADVSGKGYPAALIMANLQAMLRGLATLNWPIEEAVLYLNNALCDTLSAGRFVTLFLGKLQPQSNSLVWINAGHVPPLLFGKGSIESLTALAPPLGLVRGMSYEVTRTTLDEGDTLFCYTDGVTESSSRSGHERFGEMRLREWLQEHRDTDITQLPAVLLSKLKAYGRSDQDDDLTLLCVHRQEKKKE